MNGRASAYMVLGLRPGADRAEIERAYRQLIKRYHPDRPGGDGERAADINRAYRELRQLPLDQLRSAPAPRPEPRPRRRQRVFGRVFAGGVAFVAILLVGGRGWVQAPERWNEIRIAAPSSDEPVQNAVISPFDSFDEPLSDGTIARSVADAVRLHEESNPDLLSQYSRDCQAQFRANPSIIWFDGCSAFDEAVVDLQSRDPAADSGPFNAAAVTGREMGSARLLSDDMLAADSRIQQIRSRVEFALVPLTEPPVQN